MTLRLATIYNDTSGRMSLIIHLRLILQIESDPKRNTGSDETA
jgi:hypothetical protein